MTDHRIILRNLNGGLYQPGMPLPATQWVSLKEIYTNKMQTNGACSLRRLARLGGVSTTSARKCIDACRRGDVMPQNVLQNIEIAF